MNPITLRAHFDGKKIVLDDPVNLKADTQLIVTVLPNPLNDDDAEHDAWVQASTRSLSYAYGNDEDEYSLSLIKEPNPYYEGG